MPVGFLPGPAFISVVGPRGSRHDKLYYVIFVSLPFYTAEAFLLLATL